MTILLFQLLANCKWSDRADLIHLKNINENFSKKVMFVEIKMYFWWNTLKLSSTKFEKKNSVPFLFKLLDNLDDEKIRFGLYNLLVIGHSGHFWEKSGIRGRKSGKSGNLNFPKSGKNRNMFFCSFR